MRVRIIPLVAVALAALLPVSRAQAQTTYASPDGRYSVEIPDGWLRAPDELLDPGVDAMFEHWSETDPDASISIALQSLGAELPRERFRRDHLDDFQRLLPDATNFDIAALSWGEVSVNSVNFTLSTPEGSRFVAMAQLPIRGNAVQVVVGAPIPESEVAKELLARTVASFTGEARWALPPLQPAPRTSRNSPATIGILVLAGVILVGGLISAFEIRRRTSRGVLLLVAILVWAVARGSAGEEDGPAAMLIEGTITLLAVVSMIIGIVDLFLPPRRGSKNDRGAKRMRRSKRPMPSDSQ